MGRHAKRCAPEEEAWLSGSRKGATEEATLKRQARRFRSHQANKEGKGIPGRWKSMCKGAGRHRCDICRK